MTVPTHSGFGCTEFVLALFDWLESRDEQPATVDEAFRLLANHRRRLFIQVMCEFREELTLPDAAEEVASRETRRPIVDISAERIADVYISLYHDHLPRLVDAGLLEYDQERDLVAPVALAQNNN